MGGEDTSNELSQWFSTYGFITAERILGQYQIKLAYNDLVMAIKSPQSFYHRILQVPLKNILNGIVLQQANDYHIYAQKLFIDYLLSGEGSKADESQGAALREALEEERQQLVLLGETYHNIQVQQDGLIASSQAALIKITRDLKIGLEQSANLLHSIMKKEGFVETQGKIFQALNHALAYCDLTQSNKAFFVEKMNEVLKISINEEMKEAIISRLSNTLDSVSHFDEEMSTYITEAQLVSEQANSFRTQFYDSILRVIELLKLLPDYKIDPEQDAINRESLYFDKSIGS